MGLHRIPGELSGGSEYFECVYKNLRRMVLSTWLLEDRSLRVLQTDKDGEGLRFRDVAQQVAKDGRRDF